MTSWPVRSRCGSLRRLRVVGLLSFCAFHISVLVLFGPRSAMSGHVRRLLAE